MVHQKTASPPVVSRFGATSQQKAILRSVDRRGSSLASGKPFRRSLWDGSIKLFGTEGARVIIPEILKKGGTHMPSTLTILNVHAVFSTKERRPLIKPAFKEELFRYLGGIAKVKKRYRSLSEEYKITPICCLD